MAILKGGSKINGNLFVDGWVDADEGFRLPNGDIASLISTTIYPNKENYLVKFKDNTTPNLEKSAILDGTSSLTITKSTINLAGAVNANSITSLGNIVANTYILPDVNDGATLGDSTKGFSDLYLASGGVINFGSGNVTITHSPDILTISDSTYVPNILPLSDNTGVVGDSSHTWANGQFTNLSIDSTLAVRGAIDLADYDVLRLGSDDDIRIFFSGNNTYIDLYTGNLIIRDNDTTRFTFEDSGDFIVTGNITGTIASSNVTEISNLTSAEGAQLENINDVTISNTQWGYLGATNQGLATTNNVIFNQVTSNLVGNASTATQVYVTTSTVDSSYPILFASAGSSNKNVLNNSNLTYNPNSGNLTLTGGVFTGNLADEVIAYSARNLTGSSVNTIPYQSASGVTSYIPVNTGAKKWLSMTSSGVPVWSYLDTLYSNVSLKSSYNFTQENGLFSQMYDSTSSSTSFAIYHTGVKTTSLLNAAYVNNTSTTTTAGLTKMAFRVDSTGSWTGTNEAIYVNATGGTGANYSFYGAAGSLYNAGSVTFGSTLTVAGNTTFAGGMSIGTNLTPDTNDGATLGSTSLGWSDLYLASGGVINFANGDVTLTHASGKLTLSDTLYSPNLLPLSDNTGVVGNDSYTWSNGQFTDLKINNNLIVSNKITAGTISAGATTLTGTLTVEDSVLKVGDVSADNYLQLQQTGADAVGFDSQYGSASLLNLQGTTNQAIFLGDTASGDPHDLFGVSIGTEGGTWYPKLTLSGAGDLSVTGSITGTIAASNVTEISNLTDAEGSQLENIDSVTISNTQWGYLGSLDQNLNTSGTPQFARMGLGQAAGSSSILTLKANFGTEYPDGLLYLYNEFTGGEAAIKYKNSDTDTYHWFAGLNQGPDFKIAYSNAGFTDADSVFKITSSGVVTATSFVGSLSGNASSASKVNNPISVGVSGIGLSGTAISFDGSSAKSITINSNATSSNNASTIVSRDSSGNFSAGTITATLNGGINTSCPADSTRDLLYSSIAANDYFRLRVGGASNSGYVEIATADDGAEPIYVRQYTGIFTSLARTATLLDSTGNTVFPGNVSASSFTGTIASSNVTEISNLTAAEGAQLENIDSVTVSNTQWSYLGALNQGLSTSNNVAFNQVTSNLVGNASTATKAYVTSSTTNAAQPLIFATGGSGNKDLSSSSNLTYNPNTGELVLTGGTFSGTLSGEVVSESAVNLTGPNTNTIPYQSSAATTSYIPVNSGNKKWLSMTSSGVPIWSYIDTLYSDVTLKSGYDFTQENGTFKLNQSGVKTSSLTGEVYVNNTSTTTTAGLTKRAFRVDSTGSWTGTNEAIYVEASGGTGANYSFYGASGSLYNAGSVSLGSTLSVSGVSTFSNTLSSLNLLPLSDNTGIVGSSSYTWSDGNFTNLTIDSTLTVRGAVDLADNDILRMGSGDDSQLYFDGTNTILNLIAGSYYIRDNGTNRYTFADNGDFTATGKITSANATVNGTLSLSKIGSLGTQIYIAAGEALSGLTGTLEGVYIAGEDGVFIYSSSDNMSSGLNHSATLINSAGNTIFPGNVSAASFTGTIASSNVTEISNLTSSEGAQLENIDSVTISNTQWGYLGALNQGLTTGSNPTFAAATITGTISASTFSGALSGNASTATVASKLTTSTLGSGTRPIYLNAGVATASSSTAGSSSKPTYLNGGTITEISSLSLTGDITTTTKVNTPVAVVSNEIQLNEGATVGFTMNFDSVTKSLQFNYVGV